MLKDRGYNFSVYAEKPLRRRVEYILDHFKFKTVEALIEHLINKPDFADQIASEVTVSFSEMFRDPSFWIAIRDDILPKIFAEKNIIKIWHTACSSGEEVYSMVILLREMGLLDKAEILATDINKKNLHIARQGKYSAQKMDLNQENCSRVMPGLELKKYYTKERKTVSMKDPFIKSVSFKTHDLLEDPLFDQFDLIFCRNVMIYFDAKLKHRILIRLFKSLRDGGYLAIGAHESLIWTDITYMFTVADDEENIFRKVDPKSRLEF